MFFAALVITFFTAITNGILFCLLLATLIIIRKVSSADVSILGRVRSTGNREQNSVYLDIKEHPDCDVLDGLLILSIRGPLLFLQLWRFAQETRSSHSC